MKNVHTQQEGEKKWKSLNKKKVENKNILVIDSIKILCKPPQKLLITWQNTYHSGKNFVRLSETGDENKGGIFFLTPHKLNVLRFYKKRGCKIKKNREGKVEKRNFESNSRLKCRRDVNLYRSFLGVDLVILMSVFYFPISYY